VNSLLEKWQVPVIWPDADLVFPADSWADYSHLNENGARVFSQWLGERIGAIGAFPDNAFLEP
jgi:hypothetical protein